MKFFIKYMVSNRCKIAVKDELQKLGYHFVMAELGEVEIVEDLTSVQFQKVKEDLCLLGLEIMDDKRSILIEKIKNLVIELVHYSDCDLKINFSCYLASTLNHSYAYLAHLFSEVQGITIEHYIISHKIEKVKELIIYDELNITEIADLLKYSSVAHLSNQFKKETGISPSQFKCSTDRVRVPIEEVGNLGARVNCL
ncbi:MAG: AraC family transcriptional regulator [Bacteroidia bacterium]|nr:AraC family transcriptional regulator [Bacteroidia bacterium]